MTGIITLAPGKVWRLISVVTRQHSGVCQTKGLAGRVLIGLTDHESGVQATIHPHTNRLAAGFCVEMVQDSVATD